MNLYDLFLKPYESYTFIQIILEAIASTFGILSVYFSIKKNIWVYPTGIISTVISVYLLFMGGFLGDCMINIYYSAMSIYGWVLWSKNSEDHIHVNISKTNKRQWKISSILFVISIILVMIVYYFKPIIEDLFVINEKNISLLGFGHMHWSNWVDVFTTSIFLVGMWLMAERKLENWIFWIIGDIISVPMLHSRGFNMLALQYFVFTIMAFKGYFEWKNSFRNSN